MIASLAVVSMSVMASGKLIEEPKQTPSVNLTRHSPDSFLSVWLVTLPPLTNVIYSKGLHIRYVADTTSRNLACRFNTWLTLTKGMFFCGLNMTPCKEIHFCLNSFESLSISAWKMQWKKKIMIHIYNDFQTKKENPLIWGASQSLTLSNYSNN